MKGTSDLTCDFDLAFKFMSHVLYCTRILLDVLIIKHINVKEQLSKHTAKVKSQVLIQVKQTKSFITNSQLVNYVNLKYKLQYT